MGEDGGESIRDIQALLADISARGSLTSSGSAEWIVVRRDGEKEAKLIAPPFINSAAK
jgi:hypothetical protein